MSNSFYIYRHIRQDLNIPFYIGMSRKYSEKTLKKEYRRAYDKNDRSVEWKSIVSEMPYRVDILFDNIPKHTLAQKKENEFIALYGRKDLNSGSLLNKKDSDYGFSPKVRKKIGDQHRGKKVPESIRQTLIGKKPNSKKIFCVNTKTVYNSICECARELFNCTGLAASNEMRAVRNSISLSLKKGKPYKGRKFVYFKSVNYFKIIH